MVNMTRVFPGLGSTVRRQDELPLWVRSFGVRLDPWMPARQTAWVRRSSLHLSTGQKRSGTALQTQTVSPAPDVSLSATINVDLRHAV